MGLNDTILSKLSCVPSCATSVHTNLLSGHLDAPQSILVEIINHLVLLGVRIGDGGGLADVAGATRDIDGLFDRALVRVDLDGIIQCIVVIVVVIVEGLDLTVVPGPQLVVQLFPAGVPGVFDGLVELFLHCLLVLAWESLLVSLSVWGL